ncbi:hypothetical protein EDB85DRAFT_2011680 [Lactarius pseudohatsudake]|nr:hypothetical protein EDB85DRAFT_2011680 [Lactarius pseudohatsudake]
MRRLLRPSRISSGVSTTFKFLNYRTAAETAQAKLSTSESSWGQQRQALDREIADLAARSRR